MKVRKKTLPSLFPRVPALSFLLKRVPALSCSFRHVPVSSSSHSKFLKSYYVCNNELSSPYFRSRALSLSTRSSAFKPSPNER